MHLTQEFIFYNIVYVIIYSLSLLRPLSIGKQFHLNKWIDWLMKHFSIFDWHLCHTIYDWWTAERVFAILWRSSGSFWIPQADYAPLHTVSNSGTECSSLLDDSLPLIEEFLFGKCRMNNHIWLAKRQAPPHITCTCTSGASCCFVLWRVILWTAFSSMCRWPSEWSLHTDFEGIDKEELLEIGDIQDGPRLQKVD